MATISGDAVKNYFVLDPKTNWHNVNTDAIHNKKEADLVSNACINDARMERLWAATYLSMGIGVVLLASLAATVAYSVGYFAITIITFPLFVVPPLWSLVVTLGAFGVGGATAAIIYKKYAAQFFEKAQSSWKYADHLYQQALAAELKGAAPRQAAMQAG